MVISDHLLHKTLVVHYFQSKLIKTECITKYIDILLFGGRGSGQNGENL